METKTIRSRSKKDIGDLLEEKWEVVGKTVVSEPFAGNPQRGVAPRQGIYDYECVPAQGAVRIPVAGDSTGTTSKEPLIAFRRISK